MQLEHQVTSLELSKRLKGLGVKQQGVFMWIECDDDQPSQVVRSPYNMMVRLSAFTVAELGELLSRTSYSHAMPYPKLWESTIWRIPFPDDHPLGKEEPEALRFSLSWESGCKRPPGTKKREGLLHPPLANTLFGHRPASQLSARYPERCPSACVYS